jgi:hypothetical protein
VDLHRGGAALQLTIGPTEHCLSSNAVVAGANCHLPRPTPRHTGPQHYSSEAPRRVLGTVSGVRALELSPIGEDGCNSSIPAASAAREDVRYVAIPAAHQRGADRLLRGDSGPHQRAFRRQHGAKAADCRSQRSPWHNIALASCSTLCQIWHWQGTTFWGKRRMRE